MRIIKIKAGESVEELVARAYADLETKTAVREAATALRAANPGLRRLARVPDGARIVLPDLPGATPAGRARSGGEEGADGLLRTIAGEAGAAVQDLLVAAKEAAELADEQARLLDRVDLRDAGQHAEIEQAANAVREDADLASREVEIVEASVARMNDVLARDSDRLGELLKGSDR